MDQLKKSVLPFTYKSKVVQMKWLWQRWQMICDYGQPVVSMPFGHTASQRHMKAKRVEHIRVSPLHQIRVLLGSKARRPAACEI